MAVAVSLPLPPFPSSPGVVSSAVVFSTYGIFCWCFDINWMDWVIHIYVSFAYILALPRLIVILRSKNGCRMRLRSLWWVGEYEDMNI